ncbi:Sec63 Brl domain-containing protein [Thamnocephalis sphaerospora]|uniref:Sec63 Brl domain-containing protein n=1 Tax=Thamnocephalis sphaerospora TaxID=78915 RepID=A0A4P9XMR9_9FUNG|nr:Sec63 Brl domain-containing protein [Thamnocephalis sphaerospora]|eukprot:RKP07186.1 Sec63 Brl domain-containing protein [Thamnocephalis sphaerospora]
MQYNYDESGVTFYYFVLTALTILLGWATLQQLFGNSAASAKNLCPCDQCRQKEQKLRRERTKKAIAGGKLRFYLIAAGWFIFAYVAYKIATTPVELKIWDPYEVLGLSTSAELDQIKKHYKKLSLKYHPDKVADELKEESEAKFVEITKAYKVLTDDEIRKNYEEWGHPDGRQAFTMGIALPPWLIEGGSSHFVLLAYVALFGGLLPFVVGRWWYKSRRYTKDQIMNQTMALFFKEMRDTTNVKGLIDIMSASTEFAEECAWRPSDDDAVPKLVARVKAAAEARSERFARSKKFITPTAYKASALLYAHIYRVAVADPSLRKDQEYIISKAAHLAQGMMQIALSHGWLTSSMFCMDISQMLVQGTTLHDTPLLQLPHITQDMLKHFRTGTRNIRTVPDLMEMSEKDRRSLLRSLTDEEYANTMLVAKRHPRLEVTRAILKVIGDDACTPGAIITFLVRLRLSECGQSAADFSPPQQPTTAEEVDTLLATDYEANAGKQRPPPAHAPHFPLNKLPVWWVVLGDLRSNGIVATSITVTDLVGEREVKIQFQAPMRVGHYPFTVFVKSDTYLGCDARMDVRLQVHEPSVLPAEPDVDDDISEPEEDSLAGQMAAMRRQQGGGAAPAGKAAAGKAAVDSDTDSDDD